MSDLISIEEFIRTKGHIFRKPEIEKELNLPEKTLQRVVDGRNVPKRHRIKIIHYFKDLGNNILIN